MRLAAGLLLAVTAASLACAQGRPARFWNLTQGRISEFYLAPAGTTNWGPNQAKNDKDGVVDPDERLNITGVASGTYDVKFTDLSGRSTLPGLYSAGEASCTGVPGFCGARCPSVVPASRGEDSMSRPMVRPSAIRRPTCSIRA